MVQKSREEVRPPCSLISKMAAINRFFFLLLPSPNPRVLLRSNPHDEKLSIHVPWKVPNDIFHIGKW
jgi:hypothetical protein